MNVIAPPMSAAPQCQDDHLHTHLWLPRSHAASTLGYVVDVVFWGRAFLLPIVTLQQLSTCAWFAVILQPMSDVVVGRGSEHLHQ